MGYSGVHPRAGATINNCRFSNYMLSYCDGGAIYSVGKDRTNARVSVTKNSFKHVDGRKPGNGVWFYKNLACNSAAIYLDDHTGYWKIDDNTLTSLPDDKPYIDGDDPVQWRLFSITLVHF